jgi:hypothetical protein
MEATQERVVNVLYIIDPTNFRGTILNTMSSYDEPLYVDYMSEPTTFEEYKIQENNPNLVALTWEEFDEKYYAPHLKSRQGPFEKTTKERFWDALECLPPARWTQFPGGEFFFLGECTTANLYDCYVRIGEKYYTALRSIRTPKEDLINLKDVQ